MKIGPALNEKNLVFGYDTGRNPSSGFDHRVRGRRYFKGKNTVNFFPDGHFPEGTDMSTEGGSNPTNTIVELENPGDSKYVLRQTMGNANTEYQIYLTTQLSASTTYTLSGWYAESNDYSGASRMFHCRAYSAGGSHRSLGTGIYNVIATKIVDGLTWKYCYANITTPSDYSNTFYWFVGYSSSTYSGARYYTNLKMEQGSYPTPYHAGTRSSTNSLIDFTKTRTIDVSNVSFDSTGLPTFDGTDDYISKTRYQYGITEDWTVELVFKPTDDSDTSWNGLFGGGLGAGGYWMFHNNGKLTYYEGYSGNSKIKYTSWSKADTFSQDNYHHLTITYASTSASTGTYILYYNGGEKTYTFNWTFTFSHSLDSQYIGAGGGNRFGTNNVSVYKEYSRVLTPREIKANYNQYKNRFNF